MHEYMRRIERAIDLGVIDRGSLVYANIAHDDDCGIYHGGHCNCDPDITIKTDRGLCTVKEDGVIWDEPQ